MYPTTRLFKIFKEGETALEGDHGMRGGFTLISAEKQARGHLTLHLNGLNGGFVSEYILKDEKKERLAGRNGKKWKKMRFIVC